MEIEMEKAALRQKIREIMKALPAEYFKTSGENISKRLFSCREYHDAKTVMAFVSAAGEADMFPFLQKILRDHKRLALPLCTAPGIMEARQILDLGQLEKGHYGILEPLGCSRLIPVAEIDFLVVPCMTCSRSGDRLGHGGGYYDRYLAAYSGPAVQVCPERLLWDHIPMGIFDRRIPMVFTENACYHGDPPEI